MTTTTTTTTIPNTIDTKKKKHDTDAIPTEMKTREESSNNENNTSPIVDIWAHNLDSELKKIEEILEKYPFIAIDTEFPGVVARPRDSFKHWLGYAYRLIADNVNMLKLIQLGLTFYNEKGESPQPHSTFQFNFRFNLSQDMFAPDSIQLLMESGLNFERFNKDGIDHRKFAEKITMSGLVLNEDVRWICFHGAYDFAYFVKVLSDRDLPSKENDFFFYLEKYFPYIYDLKVLLKTVHCIKGNGLQQSANSLNVKRIGLNHQAGSDSLLTGNVFFKLRELYFEQLMDEKKYLNTLYGLGNRTFIHR
eukprot:CAMPEP_0202689310 /NCGR_PEP_ID=MMETSP1385-20130828/4600_1 /ASSEMBLY_ACC=CAM_ASM_000861 /TAXON_ID=933848 /ORGANISM="Elphidium margaritaceum" /LENGTH=305 /DNA_ID=CAMNT_0049344427 /DNA_START=22 /DNA_END=936 /DNA_ORIENTATION=+